MDAEIIAIGTELTSGEKLDTNSQWLSLQLADLGIATVYHTTVADRIEANLEVLRIATQRADVVLVSGGLGPTLDDLTREVLAQLAEVPLELDAQALAELERFFRGRGRTMPERNRIQAMFPRGSAVLANPIGTAPGIWLELKREGRSPCMVAAMPGVPSEMHKMFHEQVRPRLPGAQRCIRRARIHCFGLGESATEELLGELTARGNDPEVGITASDATITLRIIAQGNTEAECQQKIQRASAVASDRLGDFIFGREDQELEDVVLGLLRDQQKSLSTVEIATAGQLATRLSEAAMRSSQIKPETGFLGGLVQTNILQDLESAIQERQQETNADFVLLIGPLRQEFTEAGTSSVIDLLLLGPSGELVAHPLGWNGNPAILKSRAAKTALNMLRLTLLGRPVFPG